MVIPAFIMRHKSKRFFMAVFLLVLVTLVTIIRVYNPLAYANTLSNPGFESGTSSWYLQLRGSGAGNLSTTTSSPAVGAASAVVNVTSATGTVTDVELVQYGSSMTSGQTYTVSFWAKAAANRTIQLYVQNENSPYTVYLQKIVSLTTSWQQFTYTFTPTQTVSPVLVGLEMGASTGTVYVDDVQYYQGTAPQQSTGSNYVANSTCDTDASSWNPWQATVTRVTTPTHSGTGSCFVQYVTGTEYSMDDNGNTTVASPQQGQSYTASAWVRSDTGVGKPIVVAMRVWSGTSYTTYESTPVTLSTSWQQVTVTATVATSSSTGLDYYILQKNAVSGNSFYADDMQLYLGTTVPTLAPTPTVVPAYFKAINFNGPELLVDGLTYQAESASDAIVTGATRFENQSVTLNPAVDTNKAQMIRSSIWKGGNSQLNVSVPVPNGSYEVFVYTWEDTSSITYSLAFEGATVLSNGVSGSVGTWKKLGPYSVTVSDGALTLTQTGSDFNLSGIEIHGVGTSAPPPANSVITYRDSTSATNAVGATSLVLPRPASVFTSDVMIAHVVIGGGSGTTITPPAGWSFIRRNNATGTLSSAIYFKVAGAGEPSSYTFTISPATSAAGGIAAYYNVDVSNPIDVNSGQYNNSIPDMIAPSVTTATTGERLLFIGGIESGTGSVTPPGGMTPRWTTSGGQRISYLADSAVAASGATGTRTGQYSGAGISNVSHLVALRPSLAGGGSPSGSTFGSIANLNFFMSNFNPWVQSVCGDIRIDNGVNIPLPASVSAITTNASCVTPGIVYSGDSSYSFGLGQASSTNTVVGGLSYPEVYEPPQKSGIFSSYTNVTQKVTTNNVTVTTLPCTFTNCTLPNNLPSGTYLSNGDLVLNTYTYPNNRDYTVLVNGDLTIAGDLLIGAGSTVLYVVSGDIIIPPSLGEPIASTTTNLEGIFSTDKSFVLESTGSCATEQRLNMAGSLIINAARNGGSLRNERDLCGDNLTTPTLQVTQRLDYILNVPEFLRYQRVISNEVAP